ncbi:MAG: hypothetical protein ABJL55_05350 [Roseibium sp.]
MRKPLYDEIGDVIPHDHEEILNEHHVIRRISPHHVVPDEKSPTGSKISTMAFRPSSGPNGGMSVDIENLIIENGLDPKEFVISPPFIGAVKLLVEQLRANDFVVGYDPLPDNEFHGEVWGRFSKSKQRKLVDQSVYLVEPSGFQDT